MGASLGNLGYRDPVGGSGEGGPSTGNIEMDEGGSRNGASLSEEVHCRGPRGRAPLLGTLGYERKTLGMGISIHAGSNLWELFEGNLEGGLPCWGPWRIGRKGFGDWHLFPQGPCWGTWKGAHLLGTLRDG